MKVKVTSLPYIFQVLYVLCFTRPRYQVSVYRTIGPLVLFISIVQNNCIRNTKRNLLGDFFSKNYFSQRKKVVSALTTFLR